MTALFDMRYLPENVLLIKRKLFLQIQKYSTSKLKLYVIVITNLFHRRGSSRYLETPFDDENAHFYTDFIHSQRMFVYCSPFNSTCIFALYKFYQRDTNRTIPGFLKKRKRSSDFLHITCNQ